MQYNDEKDYIMRMIKEITRVLFSILLGKPYVQVELSEENKYRVSGKDIDEYKRMVDLGEINEAENILLEDIDYASNEEVTAALLFYQYIAKKDELFLKQSNYSMEEVLDGMKQLAEQAGYKEMCDFVE